MSDEKKIEEMLATIESMSVLELSNLVKGIEEKFGVTAQAPLVASLPGGSTAVGAPADAEEEKTTFSVVLVAAGDNKIKVIKEIRTVVNLGLKEAKDLVEGAPKTVKEGVGKEEAEEIKKKLEAQGAKVEVK